MVYKTTIAAISLVFALSAGCKEATAQDKRVVYESRYTLAGFILRATNVCGGDKREIEIAFSLLDPDELKAFSKAFPKTTAEWMQQGSENFNTGVMKDGIPSACTYALQVLKKAEDIVRNDKGPQQH
jgi:hypothetical protein